MRNFPWISLSIGILLSLALFKLSPLLPDSKPVLPMLASLFISELGALMTAYASYLGVMELKNNGIRFQVLVIALGNMLLLLGFVYSGLELWAKSQLAG